MNNMTTRQNLSRLLVTLLVVLTTMVGYAQDSYREALKEHLSLSDQYDDMKKALNDLNNSFIEQSDNVDLEQLTERYLKECFIDHLADMVEPMMKERGVTEADLKTVSAMHSTSEGKTFLAHRHEANKKFKEMLPEAPSFESSEEVAKIPVNPDIDAEYAAKFKKMMEVSDIKQQMLKLIDGFFPQKLIEDLDETKEVANIKSWIDENLTTAFLNSAYGTLTPEDLDYGTMLYSNESYRKITTMSLSGMNMLSAMGQFAQIMVKYLDWMESQGAQLSERAKGLKYLMNMDWNDSDE